MIHVKRKKNSTPPDLDGATSAGGRETARAKAFYAKRANGKKTFDYNAYSKDSVKAALADLFHQKCAYCESKFEHVTPADIEHWRPKGAVVTESGAEKKPAYYWLAADWDNLLRSCPGCNRKRSQPVGAEEEEEAVGKGMQFPVADERKRWRSHNQACNETPLLLHPCHDRPERFLHFVTDDVDSERLGLLEPRPRIRKNNNAKADASITVFGLNRSSLKNKRKETLLRIRVLFKDITTDANTMRALPPGPERVEVANRIQEKQRELDAMTKADREYALLARQVIADHRPRSRPRAASGGP